MKYHAHPVLVIAESYQLIRIRVQHLKFLTDSNPFMYCFLLTDSDLGPTSNTDPGPGNTMFAKLNLYFYHMYCFLRYFDNGFGSGSMKDQESKDSGPKQCIFESCHNYLKFLRLITEGKT